MGVFGRVWCICWGTGVFPGVPVYLVGYGSSLSGMGVNDGICPVNEDRVTLE